MRLVDQAHPSSRAYPQREQQETKEAQVIAIGIGMLRRGLLGSEGRSGCRMSRYGLKGVGFAKYLMQPEPELLLPQVFATF